MRNVPVDLIEEKIYTLALKAGVNLSKSCKEALLCAYENESNEQSKFALDVILKNAVIAKKLNMPVCQDTGMATVFIELGQNVHLSGKSLQEGIDCGVARAYKDGYFRTSICDPLTRENTKNNTPVKIYVEIVDGDEVKLTFMPKGFGSENMSALYMLKPADGVEGIIESVVSCVKNAGSRPCPPVLVGVGIGSNFDGCAHLAKKALLRDIGTHNPRKDVAEIEKKILERVNKLNIGCQGFGGDTTALGVNCEIAPTHIAGLPVAVNIQCHCVRVEKVVI